jgi:putative peptidoglycan lipid II flippase
MAIGLLPYSAYFVLMRGCYAVEDTRTPALLAIPLATLNVVIGWGLAQALPADRAIAGLAVGMSAAYALMLGPMVLLLRRRYGGLPMHLPLARYGRLLVAGGGSGLLAFAVVQLLGDALPGELRPATAIVLLIVAAAVMTPAYVALSHALGVPDVEQALRRLRRGREAPPTG